MATAVAGSTLLEVEGLKVAYRDEGRIVPIVDGVDLTLRRGEALGLAGESGCGKTTTALALLGLLPSGLRRTAGTMELHSTRGIMHLHRRTPTGWRDVRWQTVSIVFQGAMNALDPVMRIDRQIAEAVRLHESEADADARVSELLERVGIPRTRRRQYPHEFSGGMRQRVMIALALACGPELLIGDEPTTALDVMTQGQILQLLEELRHDLGLSLLLITHDLSVIAETCDRVAIMYAGQIVEQGTVREVLERPRHPYAERLLAGYAHIGGARSLGEPIPGAPPHPGEVFPGCRFAPRCHRVFGACSEAPIPLFDGPGGHRSRCLLVAQEAALP
jgi:peptide/nickel transport system ATP-binding protein